MRQLLRRGSWISMLASSPRTPPPVAPNVAALLTAVISLLPVGARVSDSQLRSFTGLYSQDLCGRPLKQVGGSWSRAVRELLGEAVEPEGLFTIPPSEWIDPRPPPPLETRCLGELAKRGTQTWVTNDPAACDDLLKTLGLAAVPYVGLDLEWAPTMVRGQQARVSLLQLATPARCLILRAGQLAAAAAEPETTPACAAVAEPSPLPPALTALLEDENVAKVGRGIRDDARMLRAQFSCDVAGVTELPGRTSLKELARSVGGLVPPKSSCMTNWDARELSQEALSYAAFDAIASAAVFARGGGVGSPEKRRRRRARPRSGQSSEPEV